MDVLKYKGYEALIKYSIEDEGLVGRLLHINDIITFFGKDHDEVISEFHSTVNSYLSFCKERGVEPNKPYKGSFNIRTTPEIHKALVNKAIQLNISLNECVNLALTEYLSRVKRNSSQLKPLPSVIDEVIYED